MTAPPAVIVQAGAIPFRPSGRAGWEVLLIRRPHKRKWGIPKGLVERGQTPRSAARCETLEEAGATGQLSRRPVGAYRLRKPGRRLLVQVYLMRVTGTVDDYPEREIRERAWFPIERAAARVSRRTLADLIRTLPRYVRFGPGNRIAFAGDSRPQPD